jgi:diphthine-ammonia ligase
LKSAVLYSGGKDSNHALYLAKENGNEIRALITLFPENNESWMFHYPNVQHTQLQAEALEVPLVTRLTKGDKEDELKDLQAVIEEVKERFKIDSIVSGAIESHYQKSRIDKICLVLGLLSIAPLWQRDPEQLIMEEISLGFETIITACMARGLTREWLGRKIDYDCLQDLKKIREKYGVHLSFEGGEGETFVLDSPLFKNKIKILESETLWHNDSGYLVIRKATTTPKASPP